MTLNLYRFWLPISVLFHIVLYLAIQFVPIQAASLPGAKAITVDLVQVNDAVNTPSVEKPVPPPPPPVIVTPEVKYIDQTNTGKVNIAGGLKVTNASPKSSQHPGPKIPGKPLGPVGIGKSLTRSKAPDVMTSNNSHDETPIAPPGSLNPGTGGPGNLPEGGGSGDGGETRGVSVMNIYKSTYPKNAINEGRNGVVSVLIAIDENGRPTSVDIMKSSGSNDLDSAAKRWAMRSTFKNAVKNGSAVSSSIAVKYVFHGTTVDVQ